MNYFTLLQEDHPIYVIIHNSTDTSLAKGTQMGI